MGAVFLSASIPEPSSEFAKDANPFLIQFAVRTFLTTVLGRRPLIWGGHPAITPMVWAVCEDLDIRYEQAVHLYQTDYFADFYPEENARFANVTYTEIIYRENGERDRDASLAHMRERMLSEHQFEAAIFVGGKEGILEECDLFSRLHADALILPVGVAGGAAKKLALEIFKDDSETLYTYDFKRLFYERLGLSPTDERVIEPQAEPEDPTFTMG